MTNRCAEKEYDYGMAVLRIWMCFEVVIDHFYNRNLAGEGSQFNSVLMSTLLSYVKVAVPVFMLSSFYLTDIGRISGSTDLIRRRFYRLILPHVFWAVVYYSVYRVLDWKYNLQLEHGLKDLILQILLGHCINQSTWFQVVLIILTALFIVLYRRYLDKSVVVMVIAVFFAVFMQYSEMNVDFLEFIFVERLKMGFVPYTIGRFLEMVPYAVIGVLIRRFGVVEKLTNVKTSFIVGLFITLFLLLRYPVFQSIERQYGYAGLNSITLCAVSFLLFSLLPFGKISTGIKSIIKGVSKYTMAVYFSHRLIGTLLYNSRAYSRLGIEKGSFLECMLIFWLCVVIALIINRIPIKMIRDSIA